MKARGTARTAVTALARAGLVAGMATVVVPLPAAASIQPSTLTSVSVDAPALSQFVVDDAKGLIFFASRQNSPIVVTDLAGAPVATVNLATTVRGLALSPDGSTLYAAEPAADK